MHIGFKSGKAITEICFAENHPKTDCGRASIQRLRAMAQRTHCQWNCAGYVLTTTKGFVVLTVQ